MHHKIGSVTDWLDQLKNGDISVAQQALWERYFQQLVAVARTKLPPAARRAADEEDIASSALQSFFQAADQGRYPNVRDRTELWPLLARIAACKAINQIAYEFADKRGGGRVRGDSAIAAPTADGQAAGFDAAIASDPSPEAIFQIKELIIDLMSKLDDDKLRQIARLRLTGHTNQEIAERLHVSLRTIERKLMRIRTFWAFLSDHPDNVSTVVD